MVKLLVLAIVAWLGWRAWRAVRGRRRAEGHPGGGPAQRLVRDPECNTYVPEHSAERITCGGQMVYFCSPECREAYLKRTRREI